jgi:hypothetical protein
MARGGARPGAGQLAITGSGWDPELLRLELGELQLSGFDLSLTGFVLAERTEGLTDPDDAPAAPEPPSTRARARARGGSENQRPWPAVKVERWLIDPAAIASPSSLSAGRVRRAFRRSSSPIIWRPGERRLCSAGSSFAGRGKIGPTGGNISAGH